MSDPDFGTMVHNGVDAWDCQMPFSSPHPKGRYLAVHLWAYGPEPTAVQRACISELKNRYGVLWPEIEKGILAIHQTLKSVGEVNRAVSSRVAVHLGEHSEGSLELVYTLDLAGEGARAYFVPIEGWNVKEVIAAE